MESSSEDKSIRGLPVNVGLLIGLSLAFVAILSSAAGVQHWLDQRIDDRISAHANLKIYPRMAVLERNIINIKDDQRRLIKMIEGQSQDRNAQYRQISEQQRAILEALKR